MMRHAFESIAIALILVASVIAGGQSAAASSDPVCGLTAEETSALRSADILLIGEIHDNPTHHLNQACLIGAFALARNELADGPPTLVWEHLDATQAAALKRFFSQEKRSSDGLAEAVGWANTGWPDWSMFAPIADVAIRDSLPMAAGDADRTKVRQVARKGLGTLSDATRERLQLATPLPDKRQRALLDELAASHCGLIPATAFGRMADAQRYRDAHLADVLLKARKRTRAAILIAGNGHVRRDRAVPWHLKRMAPDAKVFVVAQSEGAQTKADLDADAVLTADAASRTDPCIAMRKAFEARAGSQSKSTSADKAKSKAAQ